MLHPAPGEVEAYAAGTLGDADRAVLESHLLGCEQCAGEVEEWRALFSGLASLPYLEPTPGFVDRVMANIEIRQPWPLRVAALLRRLIPTTTWGWSLVLGFFSLPVLVMGGAATWFISRPWITVEGLLLFFRIRAESMLLALVQRTAAVVIESQATLWVIDGVRQLLTRLGAPGFGAAAMIGAVLIMLSIWTLYQNLFRASRRGGHHATT
jgi:anti-sigma factor RsiW